MVQERVYGDIWELVGEALPSVRSPRLSQFTAGGCLAHLQHGNGNGEAGRSSDTYQTAHETCDASCDRYNNLCVWKEDGIADRDVEAWGCASSSCSGQEESRSWCEEEGSSYLKEDESSSYLKEDESSSYLKEDESVGDHEFGFHSQKAVSHKGQADNVFRRPKEENNDIGGHTIGEPHPQECNQGYGQSHRLPSAEILWIFRHTNPGVVLSLPRLPLQDERLERMLIPTSSGDSSDNLVNNGTTPSLVDDTSLDDADPSAYKIVTVESKSECREPGFAAPAA